VFLTDTHCHLDFNKFDPDREAVLEHAIQAGVMRILIPGLSLTSSRSAVKLAESRPMLHAAIGVHPTEALTWNESTSDKLRGLKLDAEYTDEHGKEREYPRPSAPSGSQSKIVAIGEIGLDYYWDAAPHDLQQHSLKEQLDLAAELELPVVIHFREKGDASDGDCAADLLKILEEWVNKLGRGKSPLAERPGVLHSFSGSRETAGRAITINFSLGVTGPVTYRKERQELIASLPLERLLVETDAPFLAPVPRRGKRNEPAYVRMIADKIALLQSRTVEEVAAITTANAARLFSWE
jgi:TatD DNase family protein